MLQVKVKQGALLKEMQKQGLTIRQLAEMSDVSPAFIGLLRNEKHGASIDRASRIAEALGVEVAHMFEHKNGDPLQNTKKEKKA